MKLIQNLIYFYGIPKDQSFKQFIQGYFTRDGFRKFVETIDGHKRENGRITSKRPHMTSTVYALMEYEAKKHWQNIYQTTQMTSW